MPQILAFIPVIASAAVSVGVITAATAIALTIGAAVVSIGLAASAARKARQQAKDAFNASLRDRTQMVRNAIESRDIVLGRVRKSGQMAFIASTGDKKERLFIAIVLAAHEIDAVETVYFADEKLILDANGWVQNEQYTSGNRKSASKRITSIASGTGSVTLDHVPIVASIDINTPRSLSESFGVGEYDFTVDGNVVTVTGVPPEVTELQVNYQYTNTKSYARVTWHLGTSGQAVDASLADYFPVEWTAAHRMRGCAYLVVELIFNEEAFQSGVPNISAKIRGAKVLDPRTGVTAWSENPALLMRHYAIHPLGGRLPAATVANDSIIAAANACDETTTYQVRRNGVLVPAVRKIFTAGYVAKSGMKPKDALDELAEAMAGKWLFSGNRLTMRAGIYTAPVLALGADDFIDIGSVQVRPTLARDDLANIVTGTFADEENDYRVVDFPRVESAPYIAADGAELPMDAELAAVTFVAQAQHVNVIMLRDARQALSVVATFGMRAYPLEALDTVSLTNARFGWVNKPFEVISRRWALTGGIELTLKETDASIFVKNDEFPAGDPAPNTRLPRPWFVSTVTGFTATSNTTTLADGTPQTRVKLAWAEHADQAVLESGHIEIAYVPADETLPIEDWPSVLVPGSTRDYIITGLRLGTKYLFKARARTTIAKSNWTVHVSVVVAQVPIPPGKTMRVRTTSSVFKVNAASVVAPNSVTLTAQMIGFSGTVAWSVVAGTATLGGSGANVRTLAYVDMGSEAVTVQATITEDGYTFTDTVGIVKLRDGFNGIDGASPGIVVLSATSQVFAVNKTGGVSPESITFNAVSQNLTGTLTFSVIAGVATLAGTGSSRTLAYADMGSDAVTVQVSIGGRTDTVTVAKIREGLDGGEAAQGQPAVVGVLSNEAHTVPADSAGTVLTFAGAATTMRVYVGLLDDTANWAFARTDSSGVTSTILGNLVTVTALTTETGFVEIVATRAGYPTQPKRFSVTKSRAGTQGTTGNTGAAAKVLKLAASSQVFLITTLGVASPASITLTASGQNLTGSPVFAILAGTATLTGSGQTRSIAYASMTTNTLTVQVQQDGQTDTVTIAKLRDGEASITMLLSNETHVVPATANGVVTSYVGAETTATVYRGIVNDTANWVLSHVGSSGLTVTRTGDTFAISAMTAESGYVDIFAARDGFPTQTRRFTISKSRAGVQGVKGDTGNTGGSGDPGPVGLPAVNGILSNEAVVFPADRFGAVTSYAGGVSTMRILIGPTDTSASWTFSHAPSAGVVATRSTNTVTVTSIAAGTPAGFVDITAARSGYSPITKRFTISKALQGQIGNTGQAGVDGSPGQRGSVDTSRAITTAAWSDSQANAAISAAGYGTPVRLDRVTLYNATASFVETRYYTGTAWLPFASLVNGNLLVTGSVGAGALDVGQLSAISGNIGTVVAGLLRNAGSTIFLNLNATGSQTVFAVSAGGDDAIRILANGTAEFGGVLTANGVVNTGNIGLEAATALRTAELVSDRDLDGNLIASVAINTGGRPVTVLAGFSIQQGIGGSLSQVQLQVLINGTVEREARVDVDQGKRSNVALVAYRIAPPTGTFSVSIRASGGPAGTYAVGGANVVAAIGLKR